MKQKTPPTLDEEKPEEKTKQGKPKKEKDKQVKAYFCPKCKSMDVGYTFQLRNLFGLIPTMQCKKCHYKAPIFPLLVVSKSKLRKKRK